MEGPVVASFIDRVVGLLFNTMTRKLSHWFSSRKNVEAMNKEMEQLENAVRAKKRQMEEYEVRDIPLSPRVSTWLEQVEDIKNEAGTIPTDGIGCFNIKMRYTAGKKSFYVLEKIRSQLGNIPHIESIGPKILARVDTKDHPSTSGTVDDDTQNSFKTRDAIFEEALKCLHQPKNSKTQMIALSGMGGVGKSYMMERLKKHVEDAEMFKWIVKVVVGQNTGLNALQDALAEKTGGALAEKTSDARTERLKKRFTEMSKKGENKILVILDDLWVVLDLNDLGLPSPLPNGFKVLITSRDANVCTQMGVDTSSIFRIGALNDDEGKTLFSEIVGVSVYNDPDLRQIGEEIIKRCGNLPIALKTIAATLKGKTNKEFVWKATLSRLQNHDLKDHYRIVHEVFDLSYNCLNTKEEKALFLLSGLFPDDFDIPIEVLIRYGWGLKLFSKVSITLKDARPHVASYVDSLISANLLSKSDRVGCVVMHDLARSFVLSNSTEVKQASIVKHDDVSVQLTKDAKESYHRILLKIKNV